MHFYIKLIKNIKIEILKKSGLGGVVVQFGVWIRILHEKCYIKLGSNPFFIDFRKFDFFKIQYFGIFRLSSYISAYFDGTMQRGLKNYPYCLIFIIFGWNRGPNSPPAAPKLSPRVSFGTCFITCLTLLLKEQKNRIEHLSKNENFHVFICFICFQLCFE